MFVGGKKKKKARRLKERERLKSCSLALSLSLGKAGALEHYFLFLPIICPPPSSPFSHPQCLPRALSLSLPLSPLSQGRLQSEALWPISRLQRCAHRCFPFSFSACVCVILQAFKCVYPSRTFGVDRTQSPAPHPTPNKSHTCSLKHTY